MNPWDLDASGLMVWGLVAHLIADWPLQNDTMATRKQNLREWPAYLHAGIHAAALALVFGWVAAPLALTHLLIDTRKPVVWWSKLIGQTQPTGAMLYVTQMVREPVEDREGAHATSAVPVVDIGTEVRFWTDQVFHIACIAVAALAVAGLS